MVPLGRAFVLSASLVIGQAGLSTGQTILVFAIFVVIASLTVAGPALFYLVGGSKAAKTLQSVKVWLAANNATVMAVLCLVLGVVVLGKGIRGLSG